jgi:hypothetical protein
MQKILILLCLCGFLFYLWGHLNYRDSVFLFSQLMEVEKTHMQLNTRECQMIGVKMPAVCMHHNGFRTVGLVHSKLCEKLLMVWLRW